MERLWAPWRMAYIEGIPEAEAAGGCIFCERPAQDEDEKNFILYRSSRSYIILNLFPYSNGHLLIAPYEHVAELEDLPAETISDMMALAALAVRALKAAWSPEAFNIGLNLGRAAGAGIDTHLHIHVVPRWAGDTNFMPVLADTKVVPQALEDTYAVIRKAIENLD